MNFFKNNNLLFVRHKIAFKYDLMRTNNYFLQDGDFKLPDFHSLHFGLQGWTVNMIAHLEGCTQQEESMPWVAYPVWCIHMFLFTSKSLPLPQCL